jgi:hypothetical protein
MSTIRMRSLRFAAFVSLSIAFVLALGMPAAAQEKAKTGAPKASANQVVGQPTLSASLVDAEKNAREKTATVEVRVAGVELIDPAKTSKQPMKGQGHLHYQVDSGPVIATTSPKLSFHELTPGKHKIMVMLANNDHSPAGPQQTLEITVP